MPVFVEDPSQLSKSRLKSDLIAHNVALPPAKSKKGIYVELHMRHVPQRKCADFSSDEEPEEAEEEEPKTLDPSTLTDEDLKAALLQHGMKAGPIVASTRSLYERKLKTLLLSNGHGKVSSKEKVQENGADEAMLYSDSEEEEEDEEDEEEEEEEEREEPATEEVQTQTEAAEQSQKEEPSEVEPAPESVQERFKDLLVDTPTGIYASRRRPIKGAAGRPVQYLHPDTPLSPITLQRREVERSLVSVKIQILVFVVVAVALYIIYVCVEDSSYNPLLALGELLNQGLDTEEPGTQEADEFLQVE